MSTPVTDASARTRHRKRSSLSRTQLTGLVAGLLAFAFPLVVDIPGLDEPGERMLAIFLLAILFWVTEAIPLVATAVLIIFLQVLMVSSGAIIDPGGSVEALPAADYFAALANPVIILFLGGFMIAEGAEKYRLDRNIAAVMLKPFAGSIRITILGLMIITALLSMFMSNTATTATMFAVIMPIIAGLKDPKSKAGLALSIPLAANVGGVGTPVGTPPNAIALGALEERGIHVSFVDWMIIAVPLMLVVLVASWLLLSALFLPKEGKIEVELGKNWDRSRNARLFYIITALTILLWMTEPLHGVSSNIVGFFPVVALLALRVMEGSDIKRLDWPVLWLVSGGIALGTGVGATGLDVWMVESIPWESFSPTLLLFVFGMIGLGLANVISHSAAANLLVPLAVSLAISLESTNVIVLAVVVAVATSFGMSLPISTPPNAIAYSTGEISVKNMAIVGVIVGLGATLLLIFAMPPLWELMGLV
ncbi:DASS family sodium-coupled anion symporter [Flaviflexus salsibiostraticola]|uniref:DASS family sodium-coupled anion symporter n=1 Tax=Flaviflexus salsibiostraticola TaxID=1282737 RepID=A0A3Q8WV22_9ACTO|nr:DASS family sodium-coupled anion symporter [Flaviflexus salsibiostraticola]AZN30924.1 DASS family sodium-coupled anion symporter [Flaviflexus salsibiostraticola]